MELTTKLTISSWAPPGHGLNAQMWPNLIKMMEEATGGKVTAEVKYGLGPPPAQMDLVLDGAVDMTVIFHGYQTGRFTATKLIELPGYSGMQRRRRLPIGVFTKSCLPRRTNIGALN